ncbi:hypothetical protein Q8G35_11180 [Peribacillus simplex]|uniref:Uncharacterized protein n=2 Tax=Peribacillus TaxID=2675229 RepID=A0AA90P9Y1_9BACI|nr:MULTISPECIES: hypothetical protein [Peribacillus]MDP1418976.1 hypothetical protein [Peribacillus simplex]MDP1451669.1 hypothetical protein [Peribacillus frigoritolerans]
MKEKEQVNQEQEEMERHSLVCNDELFNKDLQAIVDDTMQEER